MKRLAPIVLVALACGGPAKSAGGPEGKHGADREFLGRVPSDTPYVIASLEPMPLEYLQRELFANADLYEKLISRLSALRDDPAYATFGTQERLLFELFAELEGKLSVQGLASVGIDVRSRFVIYGLGLIPVVRYQLGDPDKFRGALKRILSRSKLTVPTDTHAGVEFWKIEEGDGVIVAGIVGRDFVATFAPRGAFDRVLPMVIGDRLPEQSLADTGDLNELAAEYKFSNYSVGYLDLVRLAETFVGAGSPVANRITEAMGIRMSHPACQKEIPALVAAVPRVVFGTYEIGDRNASGALVLEMRRDVAAAFEGMRSSVPGLSDGGVGQTARVSFGVGIDVAALLSFASETLEGLAKTRYQCPELSFASTYALQMKQSVDAIAASPFGTMRGANVILEELVMTEGRPSKVEAVAFLGSNEPMAMIGFAASQLGVKFPLIRAGDAPVRLPIPGFGAGILGDVFVAASDTALGVSIGTSSTGRLTELLAAVPAANPPLAFSRMDPSFIAEMQTVTGADEHFEVQQADPELAEILRAIDRAEYAHMESMTISAHITERGIEARADVVYK